MHTGIVDEDVEAAPTGLALLIGFSDGLVAVEVHLDGLDGVGGARAFLVQEIDCLLAVLEGAAAEEDVVGPVGLEQCLDCLVADGLVGAGDEDDFEGVHSCCDGLLCVFGQRIALVVWCFFFASVRRTTALSLYISLSLSLSLSLSQIFPKTGSLFSGE